MMATLFWFSVFLILYVYAGYPALVFLLSLLYRKPVWGIDPLPTVTVLIAAYNEENVIATKLDNTLAMEYPAEKVQIIVAADGSDDATTDIVVGYAARGVLLSYSPERGGKMAAINHAMTKATGDIVLFTDANNMYDAQVLHEIVQPFGTPTVGAATGAKHIVEGDGALGASEGLYWKYESAVKQAETRLGSTTGAVGELFAIRRELFEPPPSKIINDDFYMAMRVLKRGFRVIYVPTAKSYERVSLTSADEVTRRSRIVAGRYQAMAFAPNLLPYSKNPLVVWQVISHKFLRPFVPFAMLAALVTNLWLVLFPVEGGGFWALAVPFNWILLIFQTDFYLCAWMGAILGKRSKVGKLMYVATFLVNSNWAALTGAFRYLTGRQSVRWARVQRRENPKP